MRKQNGTWNVLELIEHEGHEVWFFVAAYSTWDIAYAVAQVEASPDAWPFYMRDVEECP